MMEVESTVDAKLVASLLRGLAIDVETNPALASRVVGALVEAHLIEDDDDLSTQPTETELSIERIEKASPDASIPPSELLGLQAARIDLLTLYRVGGADQVRSRLGALDLAALKRLILVQQLDPDKKTAKLRSATKLIDYLIEVTGTQVEQERELSRTASWML